MQTSLPVHVLHT